MKTSIWQTYAPPSFLPLKTGDRLDAEICIVGTGIGGMTAAYRLAKAGKQIILVGDGGFASGESSRTTAQINTLHDDNWTAMEEIHGADGIRICADGYREALSFIRNLVNDEAIECGLETVTSYTFPAEPSHEELLRGEHELAAKLGFNVELLDSLPGLPVAGPILAYHDQSQFHPLIYLSVIASILANMPNVRIFTHTRIVEVEDGDRVRLVAENGGSITAEHVVMATNVPTHHRFIPHEAMAPYRSYVIALPLQRGILPYGQFADTADPYHYVRIVPNNRNDYGIDQEYDCLLVGGEDHRVADVDDSDKRFARLFTWAEARFPIERKVAHLWSAQTIETFDGMPFLGRCPGDSHRVLIITGDSGTGMTHGTLGGIITSDLILGRTSPMIDFFSPGRKRTKSMKRWVKENAITAAHYRDWVTPGEVSSEEDIKPGSGAILRSGLSKCAVYKSPNGECTRHSAVCPHLKAMVHWNPVEHTWDCPAHGSRFSVDGDVLNGPAACGLTPLDEQLKVAS